MKKRGQIKVFVILLVIVVSSLIILLSINSIRKLSKGAGDVEILNLERSIETKVLQHTTKTLGTYTNTSFAVPSSVKEICFFDTKSDYDKLRNPEIVKLLDGDKNHNLFIFTETGFLTYSINGISLPNSSNPLCAVPQSNKLGMEFTSSGKGTVEIDVPYYLQDTKCVSYVLNGAPDKKLDIVFLGYGFSDVESFNEQINRYTNDIILNFEPYKSNSNLFNFYRVDNVKLECQIGDFITCDQYQSKVAASNCPNDIVVILVDRSVVQDFLRPVRSSAIGNLIKINNADNQMVIIHEMGHAVGNLADEYKDEMYYSDTNFNINEYPNCDNAGCGKWIGSISGTDCYQECSLGKYFRSSPDSIMRTLSSGSYERLNENKITDRLRSSYE